MLDSLYIQKKQAIAYAIALFSHEYIIAVRHLLRISISCSRNQSLANSARISLGSIRFMKSEFT
jgi:hypothetical protein